MSYKRKDFQIRATVIDCINYQYLIKEKLKKLMEENRPLNEGSEQWDFCQMFSKAMLSQGREPFKFKLKNNWLVFSSLHHFAFVLSEQNTTKLKLNMLDQQKSTTTEIGEFWKILYDKIMMYFSDSISEAYHISAESVKSARQKSVTYSSLKDIEKNEEE